MRSCATATIVTAFALAACATLTPAPTATASRFPIAMDDVDPARASLEADIAAGRARVEQFFGSPFAEPVNITVAANRTALDAALPAAWGIAPSQCWMVGVGV